MPEKKEWKALHSPLSNFHSKLAALQQTGRLGGINQVGHTAQADAQRRQVVHHRRGCGSQHAGNAQTDQRTIKADYEAVIGVDAAHQTLCDTAQSNQLKQILGCDGDVRNLTGDGCAGLAVQQLQCLSLQLRQR